MDGLDIFVCCGTDHRARTNLTVYVTRSRTLPLRPHDLRSFCLSSMRQNPGAVCLYASGALLVSVGHGAMAWGAGGLLRAGFSPNPEGVRGIPVVLAFVGLMGALLKMLGSAVASWAEARLSTAAATQLVDRLACGWLREGAERGAAADLANIVVSIREAELAMSAGALAAGRAALQICALGVIALVVAPTLSLFSLVLLTPFAIALSWARRALRSRDQKALQGEADVHLHLDEMVRHVDLWRTYGSGQRVRSTLLRQGLERGQRIASAVLRRTLVSSSNEVLGAGLIVAAISLMPLLRVDPAQALSLIALVFLAYRPLRDLGDARNTWARGQLAAESLGPWLAFDDEATTSPPVTTWAAKTLRLEGFGAKRHTARWTFDLQPGEIVAIVGANGAGKTTLLRALLGLEPAEGVITYGDDSLENAPVGPNARPFAWVPQDPPVITGSLDDNLDLSGRQRNEARNELDALGGANLMRELEGVELGASGRAISAGERAWISIARAVSTGLPVLLLDEPTASLSPESEARVLSLLERISPHRAVLLVTHRPAPTSIASRVLRIEASSEADPLTKRAAG